MIDQNETTSSSDCVNKELLTLKRKIKNLERDLKAARGRISKLKNQKKKLLEQLKPKKISNFKKSKTAFFS